MSRVSIWSSTLATSVFLLIGCSGFEAYDYGFSGGTSFSGGNPNPTPTPTGNLLKNAGFESDFGDWED